MVALYLNKMGIGLFVQRCYLPWDIEGMHMKSRSKCWNSKC